MKLNIKENEQRSQDKEFEMTKYISKQDSEILKMRQNQNSKVQEIKDLKKDIYTHSLKLNLDQTSESIFSMDNPFRSNSVPYY